MPFLKGNPDRPRLLAPLRAGASFLVQILCPHFVTPQRGIRTLGNLRAEKQKRRPLKWRASGGFQPREGDCKIPTPVCLQVSCQGSMPRGETLAEGIRTVPILRENSKVDCYGCPYFYPHLRIAAS